MIAPSRTGMASLVIGLAVAAARLGASDPPSTPDPKLTPGAVLQVGTEQVCRTGYSRSVRRVTEADKREVFARYGLRNDVVNVTTRGGDTVQRSSFEVDHLIPLELGGSNSIDNLWPESLYTAPWNARLKDRLENRLHRMVCAGEIPLTEAQKAIATNWIAAYQKYVDPSLNSRTR